jgi:hypothetical protein
MKKHKEARLARFKEAMYEIVDVLVEERLEEIIALAKTDIARATRGLRAKKLPKWKREMLESDLKDSQEVLEHAVGLRSWLMAPTA